jgi:hypothetical protein
VRSAFAEATADKLARASATPLCIQFQSLLKLASLSFGLFIHCPSGMRQKRCSFFNTNLRGILPLGQISRELKIVPFDKLRTSLDIEGRGF